MPAKRDGNHHLIRAALSALGPLDMSGVPGVGCDLIVPHFWRKRPTFIEIKANKYEAKRLTPSELRLQAAFPDDYFVVVTVDDALRAVGLVA